MGNGVDKEHDTVRGVGGGFDAVTKLVRDELRTNKSLSIIAPPPPMLLFPCLSLSRNTDTIPYARSSQVLILSYVL